MVRLTTRKTGCTATQAEEARGNPKPGLQSTHLALCLPRLPPPSLLAADIHSSEYAMSKALNSHASSLNVSARTLPDLSLGSLNDSGFSFPARQSRVPSASSGISAPSTAPIGTPPVPTTNLPFSRKPPYNGVTPKSKRMVSGLGASALGASFLDDEDADGGVLNTPEVEKRWGAGAAEPVTPTAGKSKTGKLGLGAKVPTLRDQERVRVLVFVILPHPLYAPLLSNYMENI